MVSAGLPKQDPGSIRRRFLCPGRLRHLPGQSMRGRPVVEVLSGFTVVWVIILVGYFTGRTGVLGTHGQAVLSRTAFFVASPALLFDTLAAADVQAVLGPQLIVAGIWPCCRGHLPAGSRFLLPPATAPNHLGA